MKTIPSLLENFCKEIDKANALSAYGSHAAGVSSSHSPGDVVSFSVKSSQEKVVISVNPVSMNEDYQTQALNRAMKLGYEPTLAPTTAALMPRW